jgi:hypothetical protein
MTMNKRRVFSTVFAVLCATLIEGSWRSVAIAQERTVRPTHPEIDVYKNPQCGCCTAWVSHLRAQGFAVNLHEVQDTAPIRKQRGVPAALGSCHTATVNGYTIEGHVPAADIHRLLKEKSTIAGVAVPGMPAGSPGMESASPQAYQTFAFSPAGETQVFAEHPAASSP